MCPFLLKAWRGDSAHYISPPKQEGIILRIRTCSPCVKTLQFSREIYIKFFDTTHENMNPRSRVLAVLRNSWFVLRRCLYCCTEMSLRIRAGDGFCLLQSPKHCRVIGILRLCSTVLRVLSSRVPVTFHEQVNCTVATHRARASDEWQVWEASVIKSTRENLFLETHADICRQWWIVIRTEQKLSFSQDTYT